MESWVNLGGKESQTNIQIKAELRDRTGDLAVRKQGSYNCTNNARPYNKVNVSENHF